MTSQRTHYKTLIDPGDYLSISDFMLPDGTFRRATVEIESVERFRPGRVRKVKGRDGRLVPERNTKIVIGFKGKRKRLVANPTNQQTLSATFGPVIQDWLGKRVVLVVDPDVRLMGRTVGGVRVQPMIATGALTEDPLDQPVDLEREAELASFFEEGAEEPEPPVQSTAKKGV
ncbi:MAG TPA: hypothetical protein VGG39_23545 [Polyangiaceae bacterium]|jgi:hypothetical protein